MKNLEKLQRATDRLTESEKKIESFSEILDQIESTEDKKKVLWKEIYSNSVNDRESASMLFTSAFQQMQHSVVDHAALGTILTKYLERMCKSNEQILRLAELITKAEDRAGRLNPEDIFAEIQGDS